MKAILMTAAGNADVLALSDIEKPELPSPHHLRVKLAAAGVNPLDTKLRAKPIYYPEMCIRDRPRRICCNKDLPRSITCKAGY